LVTAGIEVTVDEGVSEEEVLGLSGRFETLHLPLSSSRRPMRVLRPIIIRHNFIRRHRHSVIAELPAVFSGDRDRGVGSTQSGQAGVSDEL
jgi:hypothetical protein